MIKYLLSFVSVLALSTAAYAGSCCGGGASDDAKDKEGETSLFQSIDFAVAACCEDTCGDKDGDKA